MDAVIGQSMPYKQVKVTDREVQRHKGTKAQSGGCMSQIGMNNDYRIFLLLARAR